jgi:hypothetical protein
LHHGHQFTYLEIDNLQIYHVPLRVHGSAGMIWEVSQRYTSIYTELNYEISLIRV